MYKYIACDIDGTLLTSSGELSEKTVKAVKSVVEQGCIFALSTGRPIQGIEKLIQMLQLRGPMITYNGGMIVDANSKEILFSKTLDFRDGKIVWDLGQALDVTLCVWSENCLYVNKDNQRAEKYRSISDTPVSIINSIEDIPGEITKMLWFDSEERMPGFIEKCKGVVPESVTYCTSRPYFLEFFSSKVSKAAALQFICDYCKIKREEIMALGDGMNDIPMIDFAGTGVVLANGNDEVKSHADYIAPSNDEDGVAYALNKFVLGVR